MREAILSAELFGVAVMLVILYGIGVEAKQKNRKRKVFQILCVFALITILFDSFSYMPINWSEYVWVLHITSTCSFAFPLIEFAIFLEYLYIYISEKAVVPKVIFNIGIIYSILGAAGSIVMSANYMLFTLDGGVYAEGEYYKYYLITYAVVILYTVIVTWSNVKYIGVSDALAALSFVAIPVAFIVVNFFVAELALSIASIAISMLIISYRMQGQSESRLMANEAEATMKAHNDELTGLLNRLAYSEKCDSATGEMNVGVVFADVNGLKYANDYYGHKAGDALLCEFAGMLIKCFRKNEVFRISGDEFVVLATGIPKNLFDEKIKNLMELINSKDMPIASVGYVYGSESELSRLVDRAEEMMYADKKLTHEKYPIYNRK